MVYMPNVSTRLYDKDQDITYQILAYRRLTVNEAAYAVRYWQWNKPKSKQRLKPGTTLTIVSLIREGH